MSNPNPIDEWAELYMSGYKQDLTDEFMDSLVGKDIRLEGTYNNKAFGFEGLIVGWEVSHVFNSAGQRYKRFAFLTDEGMAFAIPADAKIQITEVGS